MLKWIKDLSKTPWVASNPMFTFYPKKIFSPINLLPLEGRLPPLKPRNENMRRLFKIVDPRTYKESYLLGSCHSLAPLYREAAMSKPLELFDYIDSVYTETDTFTDQQHDSPVSLLDKYIHTENQSLTPAYKILDSQMYNYLLILIGQFIPAERLDEVKKLSLQQLTHLMEIVDIIMFYQFNDIKMQDDFGSMDYCLALLAQQKGKKTGGLETREHSIITDYTVEESKAYFDDIAISLSFPALVMKYLDQICFPVGMIEDRYLNRTLELLIEDDAIQLSRNQEMFQSIQNIMPRERALFIVGFAHLHGDIGLLKMLKDEGFDVSAMPDHIDDKALQKNCRITPVIQGSVSLSIGILSITLLSWQNSWLAELNALESKTFFLDCLASLLELNSGVLNCQASVSLLASAYFFKGVFDRMPKSSIQYFPSMIPIEQEEKNDGGDYDYYDYHVRYGYK